MSVRKIRGRSRTRRHKPSYKPVGLWTRRWFGSYWMGWWWNTEERVKASLIHLWTPPEKLHVRRWLAQYNPRVIPDTFTLEDALRAECVVCYQCLRHAVVLEFRKVPESFFAETTLRPELDLSALEQYRRGRRR